MSMGQYDIVQLLDAWTDDDFQMGKIGSKSALSNGPNYTSFSACILGVGTAVGNTRLWAGPETRRYTLPVH